MNQTNMQNPPQVSHHGEVPREDLLGVASTHQFVPLVKVPPPPRRWFELKKKIYKYSLILFTIIFVPFVIYLVLFFSNLDSQIIQPTISLRFLDDETKTPIEGIEVLINSVNIGKSDQNGRVNHSISQFGENTIQTVSLDYKNYENKINFSKQLFNYNYSQDIYLQTSLTGKIIGSFKGAPANYRYYEDDLKLGDQEISIKNDGTFVVEKSKVGNQKLTYSSINYKDVELAIDVKPEENTIPAIELIPAGDIIGTLESWVRGDFVLDTKFEIENILSNQINIANDGNFRIKDLEVGRTYKIRTTATGYNQRDYELKVSQGNNELFGFRMVESGRTTYWQSIPKESKEGLYVADYDGANAVQLSTRNFSSNIDYDFYNPLDKKIYFYSDKERIRAESSTAKLIYTIDANSGEEQRITTENLNVFENVYPNYIANKIAAIYQFRQSSTNETRLVATDLSGANLVSAKTTTTENISDIKISDDGKFLFYKLSDKSSNSTNLPILHRFDLNTKTTQSFAQRKEPTIIDSSADGQKVIFSFINETSNFRDFALYDFQTNETRTIYEDIDSKNIQFLNSNNDKIIYYATREGRNNIYTYTISENRTDRITNLPVTDKLGNLYQQGNLAYYITDKGLFVIDILKPKNLSKVVDEISTFEGPIN